jgi:hypothetical protein
MSHRIAAPVLEAQQAFIKAWRAADCIPLLPIRFDTLSEGGTPPNARATITRGKVDRDACGAMITWNVRVIIRIPEGDDRRVIIEERLNYLTDVGREASGAGLFQGSDTQVTEDDTARYGGAQLQLMPYAWLMSLRTDNPNV